MSTNVIFITNEGCPSEEGPWDYATERASTSFDPRARGLPIIFGPRGGPMSVRFPDDGKTYKVIECGPDGIEL